MANPARKLRPVDIFELGKHLPPDRVWCFKTGCMRNLKGQFVKKIELSDKLKAQIDYIKRRD